MALDDTLFEVVFEFFIFFLSAPNNFFRIKQTIYENEIDFCNFRATIVEL